MAEYIDREEVLKIAKNVMSDTKITHKHRAINRNIKQIPAADVAPTWHGRWVHEKTQDGYDLWKCSHCGAGTNQDPENILLYCFHCGAKMDEVSE